MYKKVLCHIKYIYAIVLYRKIFNLVQCKIAGVKRRILISRSWSRFYVVLPLLFITCFGSLHVIILFLLFIRKLEHPHIVKFYGTSLVDKEGTTRVILVMEKCKESLKNFIFHHPEAVPAKCRNPAVLREVCRWAKEITDAIAFIHKQGIIHRNLTLENILV